VSNEDTEVDEAFGFSDEIGRLYRYRSLAGDFGRATAENILLENRMWWASPVDFNDPMDCRPNLIFGRNARDRQRWARRATTNQLQDNPKYERRRAERALLAVGADHHRQNAIAGFQQWMEESAVCCFSTVPDNLLMWSHYGDQHRGVVFIFEERMEPTPFIAFDVFYSAVRPEVDITTIRDEGGMAMQRSVLTKSSDWAYEFEKRMLDYRGTPGFREFPPEVLKGVVLGARISVEDEEFIRDLLVQRGSPAEIYKAELSSTEFTLNLIAS
jgi:hypothetical protein|tara:strand:- start:1520 stop:2332 length:813 start_codon:yes stop_codon:yes gene_type:complete